jgi:hypothetical protein
LSGSTPAGDATREQWGFLADFEYIGLKGTGSGIVPLALRLDIVIGERDATYQPSRAAGLRFLSGVRLFDISHYLTIGGQPEAKSSATVVDPVIGALGAWRLGGSLAVRPAGRHRGVRDRLGGLFLGLEFGF